MTGIAGRILLSGWLQLGRGILALASVIYILGGMRMIDAAQYAIPTEYIPFMLVGVVIAALVFGTLTERWLKERAADNKVAEGKIADTSELKTDIRYRGGTVAAMIVAMGLGMGLAPVAIDMYVLNAGWFIHAVTAFVIASVAVAVLTIGFHWGLRLTLVRWREYISTIVPEIKDTVDATQDAIGQLKNDGKVE